ncbi:MAG TPA: membrane protein insertase YidC [Spongiibacteraceae bacterium]|nr:membrane protein insertase YidC [Spongiibacteraceae bacterium]
MDFQRYILIAAIAVLSFMLVIRWGEFQQQHVNGTPSALAATPTPADANLPTALENAALPAVTTTDGVAASATTNVTPANRYIRVHTDVLDLKIDLQGGDIVDAALPKYSAKLNTPNVPFELLQQDDKRNYIAQSGLIGVDTNNARPLYQTDAVDYRLASDADTLTVVLHTSTEQHIEVEKRFTFRRNDYLVNVDYVAANRGEQPWRGAMFGQLKRDSSADPSVVAGAFGVSSFLGGAINKIDPTSTKSEGYHKLPFKDMAEKPLKLQQQGGWIAIVQHYFLTAWVPSADQQNQFITSARDGSHLIRFIGAEQTVEPGASGNFSARFYAGPKDQNRLRQISSGLDLSVDYGWLWWIAQPLFILLTKIHGLLGNWGWSIMVLTLMVKAAFFWLNAKAYTSMANMRRVQPKLVEIRERYADDKQKQSQEMMSLYKTEKINPLGGCLPVVVQMPVFLSLYWVLLESVELRHAPWILWIHDLSAMDAYYVLPLLMGATMFFQQKLNPPPPDPMQAKVMQWMPVMFTFFFLWFPAGLVLYYVVNNLLSIVQQYIITKRINKT